MPQRRPALAVALAAAFVAAIARPVTPILTSVALAVAEFLAALVAVAFAALAVVAVAAILSFLLRRGRRRCLGRRCRRDGFCRRLITLGGLPVVWPVIRPVAVATAAAAMMTL